MGRYIAPGTELLKVMIVVLTVFVLPLVATAQLPGPVLLIAFLGLGFPPSALSPSSNSRRSGKRCVHSAGRRDRPRH